MNTASLRQTFGAFQEQLPPYSYFFYRMPNATTIESWRKEGQDATEMMARMEPRRYYDTWRNLGLPNTACIYGCDEPPSTNKPLQVLIRQL